MLYMKTCAKCGKRKGDDAFHASKKNQDGLQSYCKACNGLWVRARYKANKSYYDAKNKATKQANREKLLAYLKEHPCTGCGEPDPVVLDFDHVRGKKVAEIGTMLSQTYAWETIRKEIAKCVVRCANCHRRRTAKQFGWFKSSTFQDRVTVSQQIVNLPPARV